MSQPAGVFGPAHRMLTVGVLVSMSAFAVEGLAVATVLPLAANELGGLDAYGWAFSAFMLASLIGAIATGQAADRGGSVASARIGFATFGIGLLVGGLAPTWPVLLLGRLLQGLGGGALGSIAFLAVGRGYPESLRPRVLALLSSAWVLPSLIAPALAGQVAEYASWRLVFLGILPLVAAGALLLLPSLGHLHVAEPGPRQPGRLSAAARLAGGLGLLLWGLGLDGLVPAVLAVGVGAALGVPALWRLLPTSSLPTRPGVSAAVATRGTLAFGFFGAQTLIPLGLTTLRDVPPASVGLALTAASLTWVLGSWLQDHAEARPAVGWLARATRVRLGLALVGAGIAASAPAILVPTLPVELGVLAWAVAGLGMGLAYTASTLVALGGAPAGEEGATSASLQVIETVGIAAGAGAAGALLVLAPHLQHTLADGIGWALLLTTAVTLLGLVPAARLGAAGVPAAARPQAPSAESLAG